MRYMVYILLQRTVVASLDLDGSGSAQRVEMNDVAVGGFYHYDGD